MFIIIPTYAEITQFTAHNTHTHPPNQELHIQPHLPIFYHNNTLPYCILSF